MRIREDSPRRNNLLEPSGFVRCPAGRDGERPVLAAPSGTGCGRWGYVCEGDNRKYVWKGKVGRLYMLN